MTSDYLSTLIHLLQDADDRTLAAAPDEQLTLVMVACEKLKIRIVRERATRQEIPRKLPGEYPFSY